MSRFRILLTYVLLIASLFAGAAEARDLFVNNVDGDDLWTGAVAESGAPDGPTRTIAKALRIAGPGDRIVIAKTDRPYEESISLVGSKHSGTLEHPFIVEGNGAVLSGSSRVAHELWKHWNGNVFRFPLRQLTYQQFFLDGKPARRYVPASRDGSPAGLAPLEWALFGGHIYFCVEEDRLPHQYDLSYARQATGVTLYKVENAVITDLVVQGFQIDGIQVHDARGPCLLAGITARGNGRSGVAVVGASEAAIDACLIGDNGISQLHVEGRAEARVTNTELLDSSAPKWRIKDARLFVEGQRVD
jgi:hypothetical protein